MTFTTTELEPPRGSIKDGKWTATRKIWLKKPSEFTNYIEDLWGVSFSAGSSVIQGAAQTYPGKPWLILNDVSYEPHGDEKMGGKDYSGAAIDALDADGVAQPANGYVFTLSYETPTFDQGTLPDPNNQDLPQLPNETFLTVKVDLGMEILATDKSAHEWEFDNDAGSKSLGVRTEIAAFRPTESLTLTWHRVPYPPWAIIKTMRGKLNNATFLGHPSGTVMFVGLTGQRQFQVNGAREWQLDYKFNIKEVPFVNPNTGLDDFAGWNYFLRRDPGAVDAPWQRIVHKVTGDYLYEEANLDQLFTSATT